MHVDTDAELLRLQTALRDLVALSAIPAAWTGKEPSAVAAGLADALLALLQLDFALVRLSYPDRAGAVDVTRGSTWTRFPEWLERQTATRAQFAGTAVVGDVEDHSELCRAVAFPIGINGDGGLVAAASERGDFPTAVEQVLLSLAANQAATAFQNACLIEERRRAEEGLRGTRDELEVKVAERSAELALLAEEQTALRRLATLVARGVPPEDVFAAVTKEVGRLLSVKFATLGRYEPDATMIIVAAWSPTDEFTPPVGRRRILGGKNVSTLVFETGGPARIDDFADVSGPLGVAAREDGVGSGVGTPVIVEGRLWGVIATYSPIGRPLPADTEARLASFTELVATAIANAESRGELAWLAEEQAALRRVATLVARAVPREEMFAAVAEEVGRLLRMDLAGMGRYDSDDTVTVVAAWAAEDDHGGGHPLVPGPWPLEGGDLASTVSRTGQPVRIDTYEGVSGRIAAFVRDELGIRSSIASPIVVDGRLWGVLFLHSKKSEPLPRDCESRLTGFTELIGTAIANTQARAEIRQLAEQQAALRRVATLVAREASPAEVFSAVTEELGRLLGADIATLVRLDPGNTVVVVAVWSKGDDQVPVGTRVPFEDGSLAGIVRETGRPARRDNLDQASDSASAMARRLGVTSTVLTPIVVEGRLWGGMSVSSKQAEPLPADTESRIADFAELVATAVANAEARTQLTASRARIVAAADETRRRIERDLHDGIQQRLVSLGLELRAAQATVPPELGEFEDVLSRVAKGLASVFEELREISRGIHPAILSEGGLEPALKALCRRSAVVVELELQAEQRLPEPVEVAAYYVVSEALTNAAKHAQASVVQVELETADAVMQLAIRDDGVGGAEFGKGSGLVGLSDRIEALGGRLELESPAGHGTTLLIEVPLGDRAPAASA